MLKQLWDLHTAVRGVRGKGLREPDVASTMRAIVYRKTGGPEVLQLIERTEPKPAPGEVIVAIEVSGVNPTDWRHRRGARPGLPLSFPEVVPNQDGAGVVVAVGAGVAPARVGERVWVWEAAHERADGTAQERVALPSHQAVRLPDGASLDLGASLGIPALTAHRCLTVGEASGRLGPGGLADRAVLVAGGAGAVGHAAIELAVWAGAQVIATVSSPEKAELARSAGAHRVIDYQKQDPALEVRQVAPDGIDLIVEVAPVANAALDRAVLASGGTVAIYASAEQDLAIPVRQLMHLNGRYQFVMVYTIPSAAKRQAVHDVEMAVAAGAMRVGTSAGLPLHRFPLERMADAHAAVEDKAVGKVLVDVNAQ